ncbi:MAG: LytR C-terminal domain-containing protein [Patescibacteria group bacterium]|nr:LytR C-terminal domain-containing protein [Patescibacteria group bacterium]
MRRQRSARYRFLPNRVIIFFFFTFFLLFLLSYIFYILSVHLLPMQRISILFLNDPVEVVSFDPKKKELVQIIFPAQTHISGIWGLGEYAVDSLWRLAATEGSPSAVVLGSVGDELGTPIQYFIGKRNNLWEKEKGNYFSFLGLLERMRGNVETNMPFLFHVAYTRLIRSMNNHKIRQEFLGIGRGLKEKTLPDNSTILVFDRDRFDQMTNDMFFDTDIRKERLRVAVFNTTGRPFLATRVARILDRLGVLVVHVGNEEKPIEECEISGNANVLQTKTSRIIQKIFSCTLKELYEERRSDLEVRIGKAYERRFIPPSLRLD